MTYTKIILMFSIFVLYSCKKGEIESASAFDQTKLIFKLTQIKNDKLNQSLKSVQPEQLDDDYLHFVLTIKSQSSELFSDQQYLNFNFKNDIYLNCGINKIYPSLYINEGKIPDSINHYKILLAFNKKDCEDMEFYLLSISSSVFGVVNVNSTM